MARTMIESQAGVRGDAAGDSGQPHGAEHGQGFGHVERLASQERDVMAAARAELLNAGDTAPLVSGLHHARWRVRAHCLNLLSHLVKEDPGGQIRAALRDPASGVRREAVHALGRLRRKGYAWDDRVAARLLEMAERDPVPHVRRVAVSALGMADRSQEVVEKVRRILAGSTDSRLRYNGRWAFDLEERHAIDRARSSKERRSADAASRELLRQQLKLDARSSEELVEFLASESQRWAALAAEILAERGKDAMAALLAGISHPDARVRCRCTGLMDHLGDSRCVAPLANALQDADVHVRRSALHSLSCRPCKEAPLEGDLVGPVIDRALHDRDRRIRRVATLALAGLEYDARAVAALTQILENSQDPVQRSRARTALEVQRRGAALYPSG